MGKRRPNRAKLALLVLITSTGLFSSAYASGSTRPLVATGEVRTSDRFAEEMGALPSTAPYAAFVHFASPDRGRHRELIEGHGLQVVYEYASVDVVFAAGTVGDFRGLTREPSVTYLEHNRKLEWLGDTAPWSTRVRVAQEAVSGGPYLDQSGDPIDGRGVGIAIVDSGIDATHPDLHDRVKTNIKIVCTTPGIVDDETGACFGPVAFIDVGNFASTDSSSGHGTGVSGVAAGEGNASTGVYPGAAPNVKGTFAGIAPGAVLHGFSVGETAAVFNLTVAWDYIVEHYDDINPRIRIVNNSFGELGGDTYDPESLFAKVVKKLSETGALVVFAAGNGDAFGDGGDGSADITTSFCDDPTPGVLCVGSYNDDDTGTRNGGVSGFSSKGKIGSPETYPDILAPGDFITVPCKPEMPICSLAGFSSPEWPGFYSIVLGTSFSAPHAAGVAALLLQADPTLTSAEIEDLLLDTARKIGLATYEFDPQNLDSTTSFDRGAGLIDVPAALNALGTTHSGGGAGSPRVRITDPADGSVFQGVGSISINGTAGDGSIPASTPIPQVIFDTDGGDLITPGAADIESLSVLESPAGAPTPGLSYTLVIGDASDLPPSGVASFRLFQNVNGNPFTTRINLTAAGVTIPSAGGGNSAQATSASVSGNTITFFVPLVRLGHPPAGSPAHNVFVVSFNEVFAFPFTSVGALDMAPGNNPPSQANFPLLLDQVFPQYGRPYTILRPDLATTAPGATVTLAVDGGPEGATTLTGSSPNYNWATSLNLGALPTGTHSLTASLYLDGVKRATHSIRIEILSAPPPFTYDVLITNPPGGSTVPRSTVEIRGLATSDDPSADRSVTVRVQGAAYDSGELAATLGNAIWTRNFNFADLDPGTYSITARFNVDGVGRDEDRITVIVPEPAPEISCAPRTIGFWRRQFDGDVKGQKFTNGEAQTLAFHAVGMSDGYFKSSQELLDALFASGNAGPERRAARQYAGLLLNLAAGDLSAEMSYQAGLSGKEMLNPIVYNTAVVGDNVDEAADWIRSQLPNGDLGGANEVADSINNGHGLICHPGLLG